MPEPPEHQCMTTETSTPGRRRRKICNCGWQTPWCDSELAAEIEFKDHLHKAARIRGDLDSEVMEQLREDRRRFERERDAMEGCLRRMARYRKAEGETYLASCLISAVEAAIEVSGGDH